MREVVIYHYDSLDKFYLSSGNYRQPDGTGLPADSTDIAPPEYTEGFIPVFTDEGWVVVKDDFWRPIYEEVNYDSGFKISQYSHLILSSLAGDFPVYPVLSQVCNTVLVSMLVSQKLRNVQGKYKELVFYYDKIMSLDIKNQIPVDISSDFMPEFADQCSDLYKYHFLVEELVASIRSAMDYIVQITYVLVCHSQYKENRTIAIDSIGALLRASNGGVLNNDIENIILGDGIHFKKDESGFIKIINDLSNSIKHSLMHAEAFSIIGVDFPTVISLQINKNERNKKITYHNHSACHLVMGFQKSLKNILHNQKVYLRQKS